MAHYAGQLRAPAKGFKLWPCLFPILQALKKKTVYAEKRKERCSPSWYCWSRITVFDYKSLVHTVSELRGGLSVMDKVEGRRQDNLVYNKVLDLT